MSLAMGTLHPLLPATATVVISNR